jgi:hypothetical protein
MANNFDFRRQNRAPSRYDRVITTQPSARSTSAGRDDSPSSQGMFSSNAFKRARINEMPESADSLFSDNDRTAELGTQCDDMSYEELKEQVIILKNLALDNKNSNLSLAKRFKGEREFGSLGNKAQFTINTEVIETADEGLYALAALNLGNAENCFLDIKKMSMERNKMVLMADTSEYGWATVTAFQNSATFLDDEEDKRMKRVENQIRASRKAKAESAAKPKGRGAGRGRGAASSTNNAQVPVVAPQQATQMPVYSQQPFSYSFVNDTYASFYGMQQPFPGMARHFTGQAMQTVAAGKASIKCYGCFQYGHLKNECPNKHMWTNPPSGTVPK